MAIAAVAIKSTTAETQRGNFAGADLRRASIASAPPRNRTLINPSISPAGGGGRDRG